MKNLITEFKSFLTESSFIEVAIGLLTATAVKDLATQFTASFVTPLIGALLSLTGLNVNSKTPTKILGIDFFVYPFITALISFVIILFVAFIILKAYNKFKSGEEETVVASETELLSEIRDLLKEQNQNK